MVARPFCLSCQVTEELRGSWVCLQILGRSAERPGSGQRGWPGPHGALRPQASRGPTPAAESAGVRRLPRSGPFAPGGGRLPAVCSRWSSCPESRSGVAGRCALAAVQGVRRLRAACPGAGNRPASAALASRPRPALCAMDSLPCRLHLGRSGGAEGLGRRPGAQAPPRLARAASCSPLLCPPFARLLTPFSFWPCADPLAGLRTQAPC